MPTDPEPPGGWTLPPRDLVDAFLAAHPPPARVASAPGPRARAVLLGGVAVVVLLLAGGLVLLVGSGDGTVLGEPGPSSGAGPAGASAVFGPPVPRSSAEPSGPPAPVGPAVPPVRGGLAESEPAVPLVAPEPAALPAVTVLNNSTVPGLAASAAARYERGGWPVAVVGNFRGRIVASTVYYEQGQRGQAESLAETFGVRRVLPRFAGLPGSGLTVVVTRDAA